MAEGEECKKKKRKEKIREEYSIPDNLEIVALLPIGYPAEDAMPSPMHEKRNNLEEMVYWNKID